MTTRIRERGQNGATSMTARVANAEARPEDVVGYDTEGRSVTRQEASDRFIRAIEALPGVVRAKGRDQRIMGVR